MFDRPRAFLARPLLALLVAAWSATAASAADLPPEQPVRHAALPEARLETLRALRTADPAEIRRRWGDLAGAAGRAWAMEQAELQPQWRVMDWIVHGAAMRYQRGQCLGDQCHTHDLVVLYDPQAQQLVFHLQDGSAWTSCSVEASGAVCSGFFVRESFAFEGPDVLRVRNSWVMRPVTARRVAEVSRGTADVKLALAAQDAAEGRPPQAGANSGRAPAEQKAQAAAPAAPVPAAAPRPARPAEAILQALAPERLAQVQGLRTADAAEIGRRWGDLRHAVGKHWMAQEGNAVEWRRFVWVVEGAAMEYQRGSCSAGRCHDYRMLVLYEGQRRQLDFMLHDHTVWASGAAAADGAVQAAGRESFKYEADGRLDANGWRLQPVAANQVLAASGGAAQVQAEPAVSPTRKAARTPASAATGRTAAPRPRSRPANSP